MQSIDQGQTLACEVTVANGAGSASATSNSLAVPLPPPAPPAPIVAKAGKAVAAGTAITKAGKAQIELTCTGGACKGTLKLVYKVKTKKHGKTKVSKVTIGTASFTIAAGAKKTVSVKLTNKGASYLAKAGKHGLKVALSGSDVKARTLTVKAATKKPKKGKKAKK